MKRPTAPTIGVHVTHSDLESALAVSERMLDGAMAGDWSGVSTLQQQRARHLAGYSAPAGAGGQVRLMLQRMKDINEQIREFAAEHRDAVAAQGRALRHAARATNAYQRAAG